VITESDIAWSAGMFDTIGCVGARKLDTGTIVIMASISSPHIHLVQTMADLTGVSVVTVVRNYSRKGCAEHCEEQHDHVTSVTGRWQLVGIRARIFLTAIAPHLRIKQDQVEEALNVAAAMPFKPATVRKMLNLGWPPLEVE
jgi:hypothetical protein